MQRRGVCALLFVLTCLFIPAEGATSNLPFSLVVRERFGTIGVGDLNTTLSSFNSGYDHIRSNNVPWAVVGEISPISGRFKEWEAELQWDFWWGFSIGFAVSAPAQYGGMSVLTFSIMNDGLNQTIINTFTSNVEVSAPLMFTLYKSINLIHNVNASIDGGIGIYRAQMTQRHLYHGRYPMEDVGLTTWTYDVGGQDLGYHLGIALEYKFNQRFSMIAEGQWRFAKITTFKGVETLEYQEFDADGVLFNSGNISTDGVLYHYIGQDFNNGEWVEKLLVSDLVPPWVGVDSPYDIRRAFLDLGGFTLKIGLRIRLF
jgi:hypothetical protein